MARGTNLDCLEAGSIGRETTIRELHGQTYGLKASQIKRLRNLYKRRVPRERLVTQEFARQLSQISREIGRQVGALVNRAGEVEYVSVGDAFRVELPDFKRVRGGAGRFRGLRCVLTHLRGEPLTQDNLTDLALLRLDAMVAIQVGDDGLPELVDYASLKPAEEVGAAQRSVGGDRGGVSSGNGAIDAMVERHPPVAPARIDFDFLDWISELEDRFARQQRGVEVRGRERALLVGVEIGRDPDAAERLYEMKELARTAGVEVVDTISQRRTQPDPRYLLGRGKIQDLVVQAWQQGVSLVIFDRDLTPAQVRHITDLVEERIVDRTQLILDIFAQHARTSEGRLQVELAQLRYRLPRLVGHGESMSRLAGGIGGRGPGESKLEVDRRRVRDRIRALERRLEEVARQRQTRRARRAREGLPILSIVGYTNAGKSTLLNRLTSSEVIAADQLFATLDPSSRRLRFPREREVIVTDTVGFIRDLPADLIAGFRATLEEVREAHVLLHVADASSPHVANQIESVRDTLAALGLEDKPERLILNKCDLLEPAEARELARSLGGTPISARTGEGLEDLLEELEPVLFPRTQTDAGTEAPELDPPRLHWRGAGS